MSNNKTLRTLKIIGPELTGFIEEVERTFFIKTDAEVLKQIFADVESDSITSKNYVLFEATKNLCKSDLVITGRVEANEPEIISIELSGVSESDLNYLVG